ncbi:MAG: insulinase family protein, partial [Opitutaceae bacterium]
MSPFRSLLYCLLASGVYGAWSQPIAENIPLAIRRGELPNGLAYMVVANASDRGELCARLVVKAGSLDENDDERGFALLVQRLAADSTLRLAAPTLHNHIVQFGGGSSPAAPSLT